MRNPRRPCSITRARASASPRCSHRGKEFDGVIDEAIARCKKLLSLGDTHDVLFLQGGATQLFTLIPMNFLHSGADYLVSGEWSKKAASFGKEIGKVNVVATSEATNFDHAPQPSEWKLDGRRRLLPRLLERDRPRPPPADVAEAPEPHRRRQQRVHVPPAPGAATAPWSTAARRRTSAPPAWCWRSSARTCTRSRRRSPSKLWSFKDQAENKCMINTPPTFGVYILLEIFRWLEAQGGLAGDGEAQRRPRPS